MRLAVLTPLPPVRSGIAHYSAMLLPALARRIDVTAVVDQDVVDFDGCKWIRLDEFERHLVDFDSVVCQLGNNPYHEFAWRWARENPSVTVLHEVVLHHLLVEATLGKGDPETLIEELEWEYGESGRAVAEARGAGIHGEIANFLFPASGGVAESARHVIVHNQWAAAQLRLEGVTTPISVIHHPFSPPAVVSREDVDRVRRESGWGEASRIVGAFGFVTESKRPEVVMNAFAQAVKAFPGLRLVFVGEPAPNIDLDGLASELGLSDEMWRHTGFVDDVEFDVWLNAVDRVVSLRYPTAGESSGPVVRAFAVGRPVAVNAYAQFSEFPDEIVTKIPFERESECLTEFMVDDSIDREVVGRAQRAWLATNATLEITADAYEQAIESRPERIEPEVLRGGLPLFPKLDVSIESVVRDENGLTIYLRLTNEGESTIRCAVWGQPRYVLGWRLRCDDEVVDESVLALDSDLSMDASTIVQLRHSAVDANRLELIHALDGVPDLGRQPFAVMELPG